ncbi:MAG TPA: hypothetical protein PK881_10875 [Leptospiraceae bacterium]|nr:hypothetical protein [Leptospiraceae bacterium]
MNRASVAARLKEIAGEADSKEEIQALETWTKLNTQEAELRRKIKELETELDDLAYKKYPKLTESEVKTLVVEDKWMAALDAQVHGEMDRISQTLTQRVKELAERYTTTLPEITKTVADLEKKVSAHLAKMGFAWN